MVIVSGWNGLFGNIKPGRENSSHIPFYMVKHVMSTGWESMRGRNRRLIQAHVMCTSQNRQCQGAGCPKCCLCLLPIPRVHMVHTWLTLVTGSEQGTPKLQGAESQSNQWTDTHTHNIHTHVYIYTHTEVFQGALD